ncbi:MAG: Phosphoheptose isomerase [Candidatus Omnitrophica bacterium]|nr:Phosphoheptose isomerase [Candidatus Omnitrophota bacterium]
MRKQRIRDYYAELKRSMDGIIGTDGNGAAFACDEAIERLVTLVTDQAAAGGKLYFIGNGASASIASHQAVDFWKGTGIPSLCFNDAALLTCISNDYGYPSVFEKPVELFLGPQDVLVAISSSGESENILRAVSAARRKGSKVLTLSGFKESNRLRKLGDLNLYVPATDYGPIEVTHHSILHCALDTLMRQRHPRT